MVGIFHEHIKNKQDYGTRGKNYNERVDNVQHNIFKILDNIPDAQNRNNSKYQNQGNQDVRYNFLCKVHNQSFSFVFELILKRISDHKRKKTSAIVHYDSATIPEIPVDMRL